MLFLNVSKHLQRNQLDFIYVLCSKEIPLIMFDSSIEGQGRSYLFAGCAMH